MLSTEKAEKGREKERPIMGNRRPIKIFYSYFYEDTEWRERLACHLEVFKRQGRITVWDPDFIQPGSNWKQEIACQLATSDLILILLSDRYLASHYNMTMEIPAALELHKLGSARAIPILLSPVNWEQTPLGILQALPSNGIPLNQWSNEEEAVASIAKEIGHIIDVIRP
jgi:hypothetical protein